MGTDNDAKSCGKRLAHFEGEATFGEFMTQTPHIWRQIFPFPHLHLKFGPLTREDTTAVPNMHRVFYHSFG